MRARFDEEIIAFAAGRGRGTLGKKLRSYATAKIMLLGSIWLPLLAGLGYYASSAAGSECSSPIYSQTSRLLSQTVYYTDTTSCGFLGWSRCVRTRSTVAYRRITQRSLVGTTTNCCPGYRLIEGTCEPICEDNCNSPRYCESPGNCICVDSGFSGSNCQQPVCNDCGLPKLCVRPNTCQCPSGYTGDDCAMDIDECADNVFCEQVCNNHPGSYFCSCKSDYLLATDQVRCIGIANASLVTLNDSSLFVNLNKPFWDTGNLTQSYNLTCSLANGNETDLISEVINAEEESASFTLDTNAGYTCCASVMTDIGNGPAVCKSVLPLPDLKNSETTTVDDDPQQPLTEDGESKLLQVVKSRTFIIALGGGGAVAVLLVVFLVLLCWCLWCQCRKKSHKLTVPPCQHPLAEDHDFKNELYEMHAKKSEKQGVPSNEPVTGNCYEKMEYNSAYVKSQEVEMENEYENVRPLQYHYIRHH